MIKVLTVIGTRPEAIKMAPVIKELQRKSDIFRTIVCATAQHREMLFQMLRTFDIVANYDLNLMRPNQTLSLLIARLAAALDEVIATEQPEWVLVQGDTTSAMMAGMVAFNHQVKVGHIEAGLRSGDKFQPFPEEINRRIIDLFADLYFVPTERNRKNLLREGVPSQVIKVTGNTVIDALLNTAKKVDGRPLPTHVNYTTGKRLILVTAHRRENFGQPLIDICAAVRDIATRYRQDVHVVFPVHLNPIVADTVSDMLVELPNISLIKPVDYETFVLLMARSYLILTDSGGIQEEAPSLDKPVLVLREVTERPEVIERGAASLVGTRRENIVRKVVQLMEDPSTYKAMAKVSNPYGDAKASQRIVRAILNYAEF